MRSGSVAPKQRVSTGTPAPTSPSRSSGATSAPISKVPHGPLWSTSSLPFDAPKTGKIAVKVIHQYGDEVLRVFDVSTDSF